MLHGALLLASTRPTWPDILVFAAAAAVILVGAVGVVTSHNPVHAALSLVMTLFGVAVLFIEQQADFLAAVQIIVYAGAIVVLFLFVIMFLGVDRSEDINVEPLIGQRPLAFAFSAITLGGVLAMAASAHWVTGAQQVGGRAGPAGQAALHHLPVRVRGHGRPPGHRRGRRRRAGAPPADGPRRPGGHHRERAAGVSLSGAWYLGLAAIVFTIGAIGLLVRRNVLIMFMCIELMLNAANLTFVTFARMLHDIGGQAVVFFVLVVAAAEVVVGLGIVVTNYRRRATTVADDLDSLKG
jgi:NADH:ubiquinone oxidoreductase subunit K